MQVKCLWRQLLINTAKRILLDKVHSFTVCLTSKVPLLGAQFTGQATTTSLVLAFLPALFPRQLNQCHLK